MEVSSISRVISHPRNISLMVRLVRFHALIASRNLTWVWEFVTEQNAGRDNTYHNNAHMASVALACSELFQIEARHLPSDDIDLLLVAAMLHDFNHSGGALSDKENIALALEHGVDAIHENLVRQFGMMFVWIVTRLIRVTEFPFVYEPDTTLESILRDADALQSVEPNGVELIMEGLRTEMAAKFGRTPTHKEMAYGQIKFFDSLTLFTNTAKSIFAHARPHVEAAFLAYADVRENHVGLGEGVSVQG